MPSLTRRIKRLRASLEARRESIERYAHDPVGYARDILHIEPWAKQIEIAEALLRPPYRVLVPSGHSVGKSFTGGWLTNWWFDTRPVSTCITTAPTHRDVCDILWTEVRVQRARAGRGGFRGRSSPELMDNDNHYAKGFTAERGESFQGRHPEHLLCIFDEAVGIGSIFWQTTKTMVQAGNPNHGWVCFFNPTDPSTQAYEEYLRAGDGYPEAGWHIVQMSALDHPNIAAELAGRKPPYPAAVRLSQVNDWIRDWATPIPAEDKIATDIEWPPGSNKWYRAGPLFECRAQGLWPSQAVASVWSNAAWQQAEHAVGESAKDSIPEIGCDVARQGDDFTSIICRDGPVAYHHETHNGWTLNQTAGRLKQLCREACERCKKKNNDFNLRPQVIPVKIDPDGMGWGVIDQADGYNFIGVSAAGEARDSDTYRNVRSELWFSSVAYAKQGRLCLSGLSKESKALLRQQAIMPTWKVNAAGQCEVEPKEKTKDRLKRSPDDMDALNLAYYATMASRFTGVKVAPRAEPEHGLSASKRRGLYGA